MDDSSLLGRIALPMLLLLTGTAHALHLGDPNRTQLRVLDCGLVAAALLVAA